MFSKNARKSNNEEKSTHSSPLVNAIQRGDVVEAKRLLSISRSDLTVQDATGRTVLHHAATYGDQDVALQMISTVLDHVDLSESQRFVNLQDDNGETALHIAAKNKHRKIVQKLIFACADVNKKSKQGVEPVELIYAKVPQAMSAVFDTAVRFGTGELSEDFDVLLDFGAIIGYPAEGERAENTLVESELLFYALKCNERKCKEILIHPLVKLFLFIKWGKVRNLFFASMALHVAWFLLFTIFALNLYLHSCPYLLDSGHLESYTQENWGEFANTTFEQIVCHSENMFPAFVLASITGILSILILLKELYQIVNGPTFFYYLKKMENLGQLLLVFNVAVTTYPVFIYYFYAKDNSVHLYAWQYSTAAFGVFLAWVLILVQTGKTPHLGLYVEILLRVLRSFYLFVLTFISLLTAFALSFSIVLPRSKGFVYWPLALSKVLVMMTGELNYDSVFYEDGKPIPFFITCHVLFISFTIIVTIILFNLLIGLTVSDIHGLQAGANISLLKAQLEQIHLMETFMFSRICRCCCGICGVFEKFKKGIQLSGASDDDSLGILIPFTDIPEDWQEEVKELVVRNLHKSHSASVSNENKPSQENPTLDKEAVRFIVEETLRKLREQGLPYIDADLGMDLQKGNSTKEK